MSHPLAAAALRYAAAWPVFFLGRTKRPLANCAACKPVTPNGPPPHDPQGCRCLLCHGFYAATRDPKTLRRMMATVPLGCLLAIRTGAPSGLVVVDVDPDKGGRASLTRLTAAGLTPPTRYVVTGSGGLHLYYAHPGAHVKVPSLNGKLAPGIDIKADGGYVAAPPSLHPLTRRPYVWADATRPITEMARALLTTYQALAAPKDFPKPAAPASCETRNPAAASPAEPMPPRSGGAISHPDRLIETLLSRISAAPEGRRRATLYGCAQGAARIVAAGHLTTRQAYDLLVAACDRAGWPPAKSTPNAIRDGFAAEGVHL